MEQVNISTLKDKLSAYIRKVRAGETVLVMDRDQPVAQLMPVSRQETDDERVARLIAQGVIRPAKGPPLDMDEFLRRRPVVRGAGVLEALLEERREGR
jgi:prevent-host-death family protein